MDAQLQEQVLQELQRQRFHQLSQQLTATCWDRCVGRIAASLDTKARSCIENCVQRYIDVSGLITKQQNAMKLTFADSFVRCLSERTSECGITNIQDEADFQKRVINNQKPVLVDFHATWCGPCKLLGPRLEEVMKSHMNSILLAKVDVDQNDTLAATYKISAVPTVIAIKNGKEVDRFSGLKERQAIEKMINSLIG
ncbi:thioredoxin [Opisthorchis viverrini]|uniref:Thioredoxin n=1 Tax=Opisthorchis viverrini TaxID=6198 RepID=A0A1S8WMJ1_OPIVI|nr:thioredoxin [Opisthorchis viverrini]